ncbi:lipopolysaccharide biosynthesis protein [Nitrosomonas mobilis]|uniref:lipopolysaccharide biosynthesis protein n=1 Tax=Nitrosomonas mobilis TaxID=51642 RepID=UPI000B7FD158|nr:oligosaccharide flippase family protein [Nitrosomonas mobilis]
MKVKILQFWKNASIVLLGTLAYQVMPLLVLPVFTRLLTPEDLGFYFTWLGAVVVGAVALTLRLDMAVLQAKSGSDVVRIVKATVTVNLVFAITAVLTLLLIFSADKYFQTQLLSSMRYVYVGLAIVATFANAINLLVNSALVWSANFKKQALYKLYLGGALSSSQLLMVYLFESAIGLSLAYALSSSLVSLFLMREVGLKFSDFSYFNDLKETLVVLREQRAFVLVSMPAALINMLSHYAPLFLLSLKIGTVASGQYGLMHKTLSAPLGLIGGAILSVFREESSRSYRELGNCEDSYLYTARSLFFIALFPFLIIFLFGKELFEFVFGSAWGDAGEIAEILAPAFLIRFVASPLSYMFFLANRQLWDLSWQITLFLFTILVFYLSPSLYSAILWYSIGSFVLYGVSLILSYMIARGLTILGHS